MNKVYNSSQVTIAWGPLNLNDGAPPAAGTFCEVAHTTERTSMTALLGGGAVINMHTDTTGTVSVTLVATANINDQLSRRLTDHQNGVPTALALTVKDNSGRTLHTCEKAVLQGWPADTFAEQAHSRVWVFLCPELVMGSNGGNDL
jgi:hypothetical protein